MNIRAPVPILAAALAISCEAANGIPDISRTAVLKFADEPGAPLIVDVRTSEEYAAGHVPQALNVPHDETERRIEELAAGREIGIVVYCERGGRAAKAGSVFTAAGFKNVRHMEGDMSTWRADELPVERVEP